MWISPAAIPLVFKNSIAISACVLLLCTASVTQQQDNSSSPASSATEEQALKVLNESDWARSVTPTVQDVPCTYRNAAFPGLYPEPEAAELDELYSGVPREPIKPDSSAYLIRFQSAKPVQAAVEQLIALGDKWADYRTLNYQSKEFSAPTDLTRPRYNLADMITIAVILKHPGPDGTVLFDYGYKDNGRLFPSSTFRVWPCAGLRTANGQVFARVVPVPFGHDGNLRSLQLSFPRLIDGKPLISSAREKVEFRMVVNRRVFEATFFINASDVLDGSEQSLYLPSAFTDSKQIAQQ